MAAGLKAHGLAIDPLSQESFFATPQLQVAAIEAEILLGLWLLSGWARRAAWLVALAFFSLVAAASLYVALQGRESCGCFGRVQVNPWVTFCLDLAFVSILAVFRPRQLDVRAPAVSRRHAWLSACFKVAAGTLVLILLIVSAFLLIAENPVDALVLLRGESLTITPGTTQLGEGVAGDVREIRLDVFNHTKRPIKIIGAAASCGCNPLHDLPLTIAPGTSASMSVRVAFGKSPGAFQRRVTFLTDDENQPKITAIVAGHVIVPPRL